MKPLLAASAALALAAAAAPAAAAQAPQPAVARIAGTWDLTWQTRKGPRREGRFFITQQGSALRGEIYGRGRVKAKGKVTGSDFTLRGSRMAVPYTITGRVAGNRMEGAIRILSVTRRFTGARRP
jgi:opacity protein-like surface antigen